MNDKDREPKIHYTAHVDDSVELGDWSVVHAGANVYGDVKIGRAAWICEHAIIGGGQKELGRLRAGDFLHMGIRSFINIADEVLIGEEVGLGMDTKVFTHGGYLSELDGFPYTRGPVWIGDNVWLPYAIVLPDVKIGTCSVIAAMSVVTKDIPDGSLAGGVPAQVIAFSNYPQEVWAGRFIASIKAEAKLYGVDTIIDETTPSTFLKVGMTTFFHHRRTIDGPVTKDTERVKDIFRRHGVRFRYYDNYGEYAEWG